MTISKDTNFYIIQKQVYVAGNSKQTKQITNHFKQFQQIVLPLKENSTECLKQCLHS